MDFFASQDAARRKTRLLTVYFFLAVVGIILVLWGIACLALHENRPPDVPPWRPDILLAVTLFTLFIVSMGSWYKLFQLRAGGEYVARMLGGRPVLPTTTDLAERRLLNVVEEMALAAGIPPPPVFVLDDEDSINAFAAGYGISDAVIGVNRGTLRYLTRDELQGVVAHEFSHIVNGDMRLNLRLLGILHGILLIALIGYYLMRFAGRLGTMRSRGRKRNDIGLYLLLTGVTLWLVGSIGEFFARLIKAAISRQREYLADAAAVQFTRYPDGIAGALKKIGGLAQGSVVRHPAAEEASHMFFSMAFRTWFAGLFATHPPLLKRIRRIDPRFDGKFPKVQPLIPEEDTYALRQKAAPATRPTPPLPPISALQKDRFQIEASMALATIGQLSTKATQYARELLESLPAEIRRAGEEPFGARALVLALLLDQDQTVRSLQTRIITQREGAPTAQLAEQLLPSVGAVLPEARLPLLQWIESPLKLMSRQQYEQFRETVSALIRADDRITFFEFILGHILLSNLDRHFLHPAPPPVQFRSVQALADSISVLLSVVALLGRVDAQQADAAYLAGAQAAGLKAPPPRKSQQECSLSQVENALQKLQAAAMGVKKRVLTGVFVVAAADAVLTAQEVEFLRAIAESIDCPMPPLLAGTLK
jgi:Zn-dependent protease with chaperone function